MRPRPILPLPWRRWPAWAWCARACAAALFLRQAARVAAGRAAGGGGAPCRGAERHCMTSSPAPGVRGGNTYQQRGVKSRELPGEHCTTHRVRKSMHDVVRDQVHWRLKEGEAARQAPVTQVLAPLGLSMVAPSLTSTSRAGERAAPLALAASRTGPTAAPGAHRLGTLASPSTT